MKNMVACIFLVILLLGFLQPLLETFNVLTEKVELGAAVLNACRAARNSALVHGDMGALHARIAHDLFREEFAQAFAATMEVGILDIDDVNSRIGFDTNGRWGQITVDISFEFLESGTEFMDGRYISGADIRLRAPYVFKTGLLRALAGGIGHSYEIIENQVFLVEIIN